MKKLSIIILILWQVTVIYSQTKADDIIGYYLAIDPKNGEKAQMEVYKTTDGKYEAKVLWVENKNLNHEIGTVPIRNLTFDSKTGEWKNGRALHDGSEYSMIVNFNNDGRLKLRGYLGISLLGKTVYWTREKEIRK